MAQETVELRGHLIDSLILPRVLDLITQHKARYQIQEMRVGVRPQDPSHARILIAHKKPKALEELLHAIARHGSVPIERKEVRVGAAPRHGAFPPGFYATTSYETEVYLHGRWLPVRNPEMDSGILVPRTGRTPRTVKMADVRKGDRIVVGEDGVRVIPPESRRPVGEFSFMTSEVSTEKPKGALIAAVARMMQRERRARRPILWVCGPAVVHSGAGPLLERLIRAGYVQILFAGNALAAHDIEAALMGTSLGVSLREGTVTRSGHENHLRAINAVRLAGGIRRAIAQGTLKRGIMHACVTHRVDFVLAGSIRDDGPLPEVITEMHEAQAEMRRRCRRTGLAVMVATLLHSVATGNMLPARTHVVSVDISQAAVTKLLDRGTTQATGIVTDIQPFLRELLGELGVA